MKKVIFGFLVLLYSSNQSVSQQFLVTVGPTLAKAEILSYDVGIVGNDSPESFTTTPGYRLGISTFGTIGNLQLGVEVTNELINYGVYLPYRFPLDGASLTISKLRLISKSMKVGIGGVARYNLNDFSIGLNVAYDVSLSNKTEGYFKLGYNNERDDSWPYKNYTAGKGLSTGIHMHKEFNKKVVGLSLNYKFYNQQYDDDVFLQEWNIRPIVFGLYFGYLFGSEKQIENQ